MGRNSKSQTDKNHKIVHEYSSNIQIGKYKLQVNMVEDYWKGVEGGRDEEMPGTFLQTRVTLTEIGGELSHLEHLAKDYLPFLVLEGDQEITDQPEGYSELRYNALLKKLPSDKDLIVNAIRNKVKEKL